MANVDMHVHSAYSKHPSEWFLQRIGTRESYTEIEDVHRIAKSRGMDLVTLTDHNSIEGASRLRDLHPDDTFVSSEITTYFPENGCKIHVLTYDIDEALFRDIDEARASVYELRDLLKARDVACSVAHATYGVNGRLDLENLEKLILLFDTFETVNGGRLRVYNQAWRDLLKNLTPDHLNRLRDKHDIEPWSETPWVKGFTGGSDDHAGLFIGESHTAFSGRGVEDLIHAVKSRETVGVGRHGDHKSLAFAIYKIAYDFSRSKADGGAEVFRLINSLMFDDKKMGIKNWLTIQKMKMKKGDEDRILARFFDELADSRANPAPRSEEQLDRLYSSLSNLVDGFFQMILGSFESDLRSGDPGRMLRNLSASLPVLFLSTPFFSALSHLHQGKKLIDELRRSFDLDDDQGEKKTLWFSDTVTDLNGVAVTMRNIAWCAFRHDRPLKLVTTLPDDEFDEAGLPPNVINLPCLYARVADFYTSFTLRLPSILRALDRVAAENPDKIIISTPGPVGALGAVLAKIQSVQCVGVYHTDFSKQADLYIGDEWISSVIEKYTRWFYRRMDEIRVPTRRYMDMLLDRGFARDKMKIFSRGIDADFVRDAPSKRDQIRNRHELGDGPTLFYAGRIGKEKNVDFLFEIFDELATRMEGLKLVLAGDGPERDRLREERRGDPGVVFAGRVPREELCHYYQVADVFLFPSTTDTFGMVVLEAQACGTPAVVTDVGGPQEIVRDGQTGFIVPATDRNAWVATVGDLLELRVDRPDEFNAMRQRTKEVFRSRVGWEGVLDEMIGNKINRFAVPPVVKGEVLEKVGA